MQAVVEVFRANNPGEDIKTVDLSISIRGVTCVNKADKVTTSFRALKTCVHRLAPMYIVPILS